MPISLPSALDAGKRMAETVARWDLEFAPVTKRFVRMPTIDVVARTQAVNARRVQAGLAPLAADAGPDGLLPEYHRSDARWIGLGPDEAHQDEVIPNLLGAAVWTAAMNLLPKHLFWLWPFTDFATKLDAHYATYADPFRWEGAAATAAGRWTSNEAFAAQRLAGVNPVMIRPVTDENDLTGFGDCVIDQQVIDLVTRVDDFDLHVDLALAVEQERLYVVDYRELIAHVDQITQEDGIPTQVDFRGLPLGLTSQARKYTYAPIALFYWHGDLRTSVDAQGEPIVYDDEPSIDGRLLPLAIQLRRSGVDGNSVILPHHPNWMIARGVVQASDALVHELRVHLAWTHLALEAICLSFEHTLHLAHPIRQLLQPHFRMHLRIQTILPTLTDPGEPVDQLLGPTYAMDAEIVEEAVKDWRLWLHGDPCEEMGPKGRNMLSAPIRYPYRDDGMRIWRAIETFVDSYVDHYYPTDAEVTGDTELAAFVDALQGKQGAARSELGGRAWPEPIATLPGQLFESVDDVSTRAEVKQMLAAILWTAGPQHAAVNYPQWEYMGHPGNMPLAIYARAPDGGFNLTGPPSGYYPPEFQARLQVLTMFLLAGSEPYIRFGMYEDDPFETAVLPFVQKFQSTLRDADDSVTAKIDAANRVRPEGHRYEYLLPDNIPNSTNV